MNKDRIFRMILPLKDRYHIWKLQKYYRNRQTTEEEDAVLDFISSTRRVEGLNYPFTQKYEKLQYQILWDEDYQRYKIAVGNQYVYMRQGISEVEAENIWRTVCEEQDLESPHRYTTSEFDVNDGDVVIDAGVAEGNFSIECMDRVKKLILIECDNEWLDALKITFKKEIESGKVVIIEKFLGDKNDDKTITLDRLYETYGKIDFVKMDIEGAEQAAIRGGQKLIQDVPNLRMAVCAYHTPTSYDEIYNMLEKDFSLTVTPGYIILNPLFGWKPPYLRRGLIRATRKNKQ